MPYKNKHKQIEYQRQWLRDKKKKGFNPNKIARDKKRALVESIKDSKSCVVCGENDNVCLDFHHYNNDKHIGVSQLMMNKVPDKRIIEEIEKCTVLCSNCHRKVHAGLLKL